MSLTLSYAEADIFSVPLKNIDGEADSLAKYKGKVMLVANTASECGYTRQYAGLQKVYDQFKDQGFVVLGFPSNDFGGQEPGQNKDIKKFCQLNYGVNFPLFEKGPVKGEEKQKLFAELLKLSSDKSEIKWNFEKFLIGKDGKLKKRFSSKDEPEDIAKFVAEELKAAK